MAGFKFRRQDTIGPFVVDFWRREVCLVIELDGPVHDDPVRHAADGERQRWLELRGYRVIRFRNEEVMQRCDFVLEAICQSFPPPSTLTLSRRGAGTFDANRMRLSTSPAG
jgi:very-short-patch-repair endonuclease